jgi:HD-GYP domain-containing protein (c-di-GMP phosphodiesterase class II)
MACDHSAPHSGALRYLRDTAQVRLAVLCDHCGAERAQLGSIDYRPNARRVVGQLAELTARSLGLNEHQIARVRLAALVCDVGRGQIPSEILNKRGRLTDVEWRQIRRQPELGAALLSDASFDDIRTWILCQRERPDGGGYPRGLSLEQIPLEARILAVGDAYVAMINERPHRPPRRPEAAERELLRCAGSQFDAEVVDAFIDACVRSRPRDTSALA